MSSRRARDQWGRPVVVMTTPGEPPRIFRVVGDELGSGPHGEITFMSAKTGRYVKPPERDEAVAPPERPQES